MTASSIHVFFRDLPEKFDAEAAEGVTAVYQFDLSGPQGGRYQLVIEDGACSVREGAHPNPHVVLAMSGEDCLGVLSGRDPAADRRRTETPNARSEKGTGQRPRPAL